MRFILVLISLLIFSSCTRVFFQDNTRLIPALKEPVEMEFTSYRDLIFLEAEINGVEGLFLFDNGFSQSAVNKKFASKAGIEFTDESALTDYNNKKTSIPLATIDTVRIQDQTFVETMVYLINTDNFLPCFPIDGIIGASIINEINWKINFENEKIMLSSIPFPETGKELRISFEQNNTTTVPVTINNITLNTKIDFGKTDEFEVSVEQAKKIFKQVKAIEFYGNTSLSTHGLGKPETSYTLVDEQNISHDERPLPIPAVVDIAAALKYEGYLGVEYFRKYNTMVINSTLATYILPYTAAESPAKENLSYGLVTYKTGNSWRVIQKNTADKQLKNINVNDEILLIDNLSTDGLTICEYQEYVKTKLEKKEKIVLKIKGHQENIVLEPRKPTSTVFN